MKLFKAMAATAAFALAAPLSAQDAPGVSEDEIRIGGAHDLSGIFAPFSVPAVTAAQQYFDKINAEGGVHGRKINYIVEDHGYQVPRAVQAGNKLINRDEVFAMLLNLGTPHNIALFQLMEPEGIPNVSPLTAARQMIEPPAPWKFAGTSSYYDGILATTEYLIENEGTSKVCLMLLPTDFGNEMKAAVEKLAEEGKIEMGVEIGHKPDESDFTGALGKVKDAGCDTVGMALGVGQIINAVATANKLGMDTKFVLSSAGFHTVIAKGLAQQGVTEGVFAGSGWQDLEERLDNPAVQEFVASYKEATGEDYPGTGAVLGRSAAQTLVAALEAAGPELTHESFIKAMESLNYEDEISGNTVNYGPEDHVGAEEIFVSKIQDGRWTLVKKIEPDSGS